MKLNRHVSPESLVGLEAFSHVWISFKFHLNTNTLKESKAFSSTRSTFNAKITLPMLKQKLGVFATRSPHRPNPVGVTLARIERIDKAARTVYLSACDLVEGTPVLDIKVGIYKVYLFACLLLLLLLRPAGNDCTSSHSLPCIPHLRNCIAICSSLRYRRRPHCSAHSKVDPGDSAHAQLSENSAGGDRVCASHPGPPCAVQEPAGTFYQR
jgi:tRNA (Thr-GGU) A37 N-methylase